MLPVGLQLYGIRDALENNPQDFGKVMKKVKAMGFDGVELAGLYGLAPETVRQALDEAGLTPFSAHVPLADLMADIEAVIKDYSIIGCKYIAVPYLPEEYRPNTPGYPKAIAEMDRIGGKLKENGIQLVYHNHDFEFVRLANGTYGLDDIYQQISAGHLMAEPDTCWIKVAGEEPGPYILKYANRCPIVHLKDFILEGKPKNLYKLIGLDEEEKEEDTGKFEFRPVGSGQQNWRPILDAALKVNAEWVVVEQDEHYDLTCMEAARLSREFLKTLGW